MSFEHVGEIEFEYYKPEQFTKLKGIKNRINRITSKYIPTKENEPVKAFDLFDEIQNDIMHVAALMVHISAIIGYIDGLSDNLEDIRKLNMAEARMSNIPQATAEDPKPKKKTDKDREAESRIAAREIIETNVNLRAMAVEYRRFQYQVNSWIDVMTKRITILNGERYNDKRIN